MKCHLCSDLATREMLTPPEPMPPLEFRSMCDGHADRLQRLAAESGTLLAHVPFPVYEPPTLEHVGNLHDLLAHVDAAGECDPD